jgi:lysophospholipase L1-like esterase
MKKLFVIGDSISCYYGKYLKDMLDGFCEYDRKGGKHKLENLDDCTDGVNGGDSSMVLAYLKSVINRDFFSPDFILVNCGLHDTKTSDGKLQVPVERYRENLWSILNVVKQKNIKTIWVRTTPANEKTTHWEPEEIRRRQDDIDLYNKVADEVMAENNIPVIDLHQFTLNLGPDIYLNKVDSVHFNEQAAQLQASYIAGAVAVLSRRALPATG